MKVLVTGATGYIGGRVVSRLLDQGHDVRILARSQSRVEQRPWSDRVEVIEGNLLSEEDVARALKGVDVAYYLAHAMGGEGDFAEEERTAAENFARCSLDVRHIIYLGGLMPREGKPRDHLKSRALVGEILRSTNRATEFRAGPIIGSGSASFEMVRYLSERLPLQILPRWASHEIQPIGIVDVLAYLIQAVDKEPLGIVEIGTNRLTFRDLLDTYALARGLKRFYIPIPFSIRSISAGWVTLITPLPLSLAFPLVDGVISPIIADTRKAEAEFPGIEPMPVSTAIERAIKRTKEHAVETRWSRALNDTPEFTLKDEEGFFKEQRSCEVQASAEDVYASASALGGESGWPTWNWAWKMRGAIDHLAGGPGLRRGRRSVREILPGETLDFWRVERVEPPSLILLRAEMKMPGRAWLRFQIEEKAGTTTLLQTALYQPRGLWGLVYWWLLSPAHHFIFGGMIRKIAKAAEKATGPRRPTGASVTDP